MRAGDAEDGPDSPAFSRVRNPLPRPGSPQYPPPVLDDEPTVENDPATVDDGGPPLTRGMRGLFVVALVVIVLAGARAASDLVAQTLLGLVLAVGAGPVLGVAERRGWPATVGAILASVALLVVTVAFGVLLAFAGSQLAKELPRFRSAFAATRLSLSETLRAHDLDPLLVLVNRTPDLSQMDVLTRVFDAATSLGSAGFVLFVALFALFEAPTFANKWRRVTSADPASRENAARVLVDVQRYLLVKTGTCIVTGLLVGLWTAGIGLDAAVLWGLLAFALNYIPFLGSLLAGIPPTLVALLTIDVVTGVLVGVGILLINFLIGNVVEPRVMGRTMGLSPLVVLLSVAVWGWVLGPVGALLSVPLTVIVKLALERSDRYAWVAVILDSPVRFRS